MRDKTQKKNSVLRCLLAGILLFPTVGYTAPRPDPVMAVQDPTAVLYQLGVMWMNGEGVEQDIELGRYWIHLAARHGYPLARYDLGVMYFDGIGGEQSRQCAQWWLNLAAKQGNFEVHQMAEQALLRIEFEMRQLPKVYRPVTSLECDRLPPWPAEVLSATDTPVLLEDNIETKNTAMIPEGRIREKNNEKSGVSEAPTTDIPNSTRVMEKEENAENGGDVANGNGIDKPSELMAPEESDKNNTTETDEVTVVDSHQEIDEITLTDTSGVTTTVSEDGIHHAEKSDNEETERVSKGTSRTEGASEVATTKINVPTAPVVKSTPVLDLGGNPATAQAKHYTLQLSGGTTQDELFRLARRHNLKNYKVYETERHGRRWYVLVSGEYATLTTANQALKLLPLELRKNGPWVRSLRQVQAELVQGP